MMFLPATRPPRLVARRLKEQRTPFLRARNAAVGGFSGSTEQRLPPQLAGEGWGGGRSSAAPFCACSSASKFVRCADVHWPGLAPGRSLCEQRKYPKKVARRSRSFAARQASLRCSAERLGCLIDQLSRPFLALRARTELRQSSPSRQGNAGPSRVSLRPLGGRRLQSSCRGGLLFRARHSSCATRRSRRDPPPPQPSPASRGGRQTCGFHRLLP